MPKRVKSYHSWLIERLSDSKEAERYLRVAAEDSPEMFLKALRNVAEANKISKVAENAGVNRESLYRTLSEEGNPRLSTLESVLDAVGMTLTVALKKPTQAFIATSSTNLATTFAFGATSVQGQPPTIGTAAATTHYQATNLAGALDENDENEYAAMPSSMVLIAEMAQTGRT